MKRTTVLSIFLCICAFAKTQNTIEVKPYFYDEFKLGTVFFSEGTPVRARLNYNFVTQEMQFLNHQNNDEILNLVRTPKMTHIEIGSDIFVPVESRGFAHVIVDGPITLLQKKRVFVEADRKGLYGTPTSTAAVETPDNFFERGLTGQRFTNFVFDTKTRTELKLYFMKNNRVYTASRRNFLRLYSEIRPQLEKYLSEHDVDFRNDEHLRGLTRFANNLLIAK